MKKIVVATLLVLTFALAGCGKIKAQKIESSKLDSLAETAETIEEVSKQQSIENDMETSIEETSVEETTVEEATVEEATSMQGLEKTECLPEVQEVEFRTLEETYTIPYSIIRENGTIKEKGTYTSEIPVVVGDYYLQVDDMVFNLVEEMTAEEIYNKIMNSRQKDVLEVQDWNPQELIAPGEEVYIDVTKYGEEYISFAFKNYSEETVEFKDLTIIPIPRNLYKVNDDNKWIKSCYLSGGICLDGEDLTYSNISELLEQWGYVKEGTIDPYTSGEYKKIYNFVTENRQAYHLPDLTYYEAYIVLYDKKIEENTLTPYYKVLSIRFYIDTDTQECRNVTISDFIYGGMGIVENNIYKLK